MMKKNTWLSQINIDLVRLNYIVWAVGMHILDWRQNSSNEKQQNEHVPEEKKNAYRTKQTIKKSKYENTNQPFEETKEFD